MSKKLTYEKQLSLIKDKNDGLKVKELSEKYQIAECTIYNIIKRGAKEYKVANKRYSVNSEYFKDINTEEKAYWLGFLYADGYVRMKYDRSGELKLKLGRKDKEHIELFKKCLESTHPIKDLESIVVVNEVVHKSDVSSVSIYNTEIVQDLYRHGCTNAKTFTIEFPELREDLIRHFIRGYFDGDGHVIMTDSKRCVGITSGSYDFLEALNNVIGDFLGFKFGVYKSGDNCKVLQIFEKDRIHSMYKFLYNDSTIFLNRKKDRFDNYYLAIKPIL